MCLDLTNVHSNSAADMSQRVSRMKFDVVESEQFVPLQQIHLFVVGKGGRAYIRISGTRRVRDALKVSNRELR